MDQRQHSDYDLEPRLAELKAAEADLARFMASCDASMNRLRGRLTLLFIVIGISAAAASYWSFRVFAPAPLLAYHYSAVYVTALPMLVVLAAYMFTLLVVSDRLADAAAQARAASRLIDEIRGLRTLIERELAREHHGH